MAGAGLSRPGLTVRSWLLVLLVVGLVVGVVAWALLGLAYGPLLGWIVAALVFEIRVWSSIGRADGTLTRERAQRDDPTNTVTDLLLLAANLVSLGVIGLVIFRVSTGDDLTRLLAAALALVSAGVSWVLVQTLFTLRYAALYYSATPPGGIDFNDDEPPRYVDFAYLSFTMGMTYQVSDNNLQTSAFRSLVLRHALTSYVFGTVILATTINLVVGISSAR